jgi:signal transduction histidine kinase
MTAPLRRFLPCIFILALATGLELRAEPIPLKSAEATFHSRDPDELARVIDGIPIGPEGWSVAPNLEKPQAIIFRSARQVEATELDVTLYFLSGKPNLSIAEFSLSYTTDAEPSLDGNWKPLEIRRFTAEVATLQRTEQGHLRAAMLPDIMTGEIPDDTYRIAALSPEGRATGFRLDVFPVFSHPGAPPWMSWGSPHDFVLTEFRVEEHARESTNIALHCPAKASHPLFQDMQPGALTDGLPATIVHPRDETPNPNFYFEIDLGRIAAFNHLALRTRGDGYIDRFSRILIRLYDADPETGAPPTWEGMIRADGSYPPAGTADIVQAAQGRGVFRGRYLRLSSDSKVQPSPQLAEVEAYASRTPEVIEALADGREIPIHGGLDLPPGVRRLSLRLRIPQSGMPPGNSFRWRLRGDLEAWQMSRLMTLDMPCPPPGKTTIFEAQALHSDHQWDATVFRLPITSRQYFWENRWFQGALAIVILGVAMWLERTWTRRRAARQLAEMKSRAALAEERARIARDLHDDLGANLARIGFLTELAERALAEPERARDQLGKIYTTTRDLTRQLDSVVWAVDPANDNLESLARYIHGLASEYLGLAEIRCDFTNTERMPAVQLGSTFRHHLLMIVKEALHNIVAHAAASVVTLRIAVEGRQLLVEIADNGRGLPKPETMKPGNGLQNMKSRALDIGGSCDFLASETGTGTRILLTLPLPNPPPKP